MNTELDMGRKREISNIKVNANRQNSLKSTGPKSKNGKSIVKWNAIKHGLLAREVVINTGNGKESSEEFDFLLNTLQKELTPFGILEEMLVEKIAICYWRLRRVLKCEKGEIRKHLDSAVWHFVFKKLDEFYHNKDMIFLESYRRNLDRSSLGLKYLIGILVETKDEIEATGSFSDNTATRLLENFGQEQGKMAFNLTLFKWLMEKAEKPEKGPQDEEEPPDPKVLRKSMIELIDSEIEKMTDFKAGFEEKDGNERNAEFLSLYLPDKPVIDKILRYETTIDRQLYRAIDQLERLQRARQGDSVPPPINVHLSHEN